MDLSNFHEVSKQIRKYDYGIGISIENLYVSCYDCKVEESDYCNLKNDLTELVDKLAVKTLLKLKINEEYLKDKEVDEKWRQFQAVSEENRDLKADAYEAYKDADDEVSDIRTEIEEIEYHIEATMKD